METFLTTIINTALIPVQFFLIFFDWVIYSTIPNIEYVSIQLTYFINIIGQFPDFLCKVFGFNPILWNIAIGLILVYLTILPMITFGKMTINILIKIKQAIFIG